MSGGVARLTNGGPYDAGIFSHSRYIYTTLGFSARFRFRFGVAQGGTRRFGFCFIVQNVCGFAGEVAAYIVGNPGQSEWLGTQGFPQMGAFFRYDSGVSSVLYYEGRYQGYAPPNDAAITPDFASGHTFEATLVRTNPTGVGLTNGTLTLGLKDETTNTTWSRVTSGLDFIQARFLVGNPSNPSEVGDRAYASFVAINGVSNNVIDILDWDLTQPGVTSLAPVASATWTAPGTSSDLHRITTTITDANGRLIRPLGQAIQVAGGASYTIKSDGVDDSGIALPSGYKIRLGLDHSTSVGGMIANSYADPTSKGTGLTGIEVSPVAVSPDGLTVMVPGAGGDTVRQSGLYPIDPTNGHVIPSDIEYVRDIAQRATAVAIQDGSDGLVFAVANNDATDESALVYWLVKFRKRTAAVNPLRPVSCTDSEGTTYTDGTKVYLRAMTMPTRVLELERTTGTAFSSIPANLRYDRWTAIACDYTQVVIGSRAFGKVVIHDPDSFGQIRPAISVPYPCGVAILPNGNIAVAHGATSGATTASVVKVYSATDSSLIGTMAGLDASLHISGLSCAGGRLVVFENGPGQRRHKVYTVSGNAATSLVRTVGYTATYGTDDGVYAAWDLVGGSITTAGEVYTTKRTISYELYAGFGPDNPGGQVQKFNSTGIAQWDKHALGYTNSCVGGPQSDPTLVINAKLRSFRFNPDDCSYTYLGSLAYPGYTGYEGIAANPWISIGTGQCSSVMRWVRGTDGNDYLGIPDYRNRQLTIFRLRSGYLHPVAAFGTDTPDPADHRRWTWHDAAGDGYPTDNQIAYYGTGADHAVESWPQLGPGLAIWYTQGNEVHRLPFGGFSNAGNPTWNPALGQPFATPSTAGYGTAEAFNCVPSPQGPYLLTSDLLRAPLSSAEAFPGYSMGGARTLIALDPSGSIRWQIDLPESSQSIDAVDEYVVIGGLKTERFWVYKADGSLVTQLNPSTIDDFLDFKFGAMSVSKLPDGRLVIWGESIGNSAQVVAVVDPSITPDYYSATAVAGQTVALTAESGGPGPSPGVTRFLYRMIDGVSRISLRTV